MRLTPRARRGILVGVGTALLALTAVWFLRWKIAEDLVRAELKKVAGELFDADIKVKTLRGSLLTSIRAEDVVLRPREGSPFREFTIRDLEIGYGLFGRGTLDVRLSGGRFAFAKSKSAEPATADELLDTAREISRFRFPGRLKATDSVLVLPDGPELHIEEGEIDYGTWRLTLSPSTIPVKGEASVRVGRVEAQLEPGRLSLLEEAEGGLLVACEWNRESSHVEIHWGVADGNYLSFKGKVEPELDAVLYARILRLDAPIVRAFITGLPLDGEADLEVALGGTADVPTVDGRLLLLDLMIGEERIERLSFPLRAEPGALVLPRTTQITPVGPMTLEARIPVPWVKREAVAASGPPAPPPDPGPEKRPDLPLTPAAMEPPKPLPPVPTAEAKIEVASVEGFIRRLPEEIRPWIPRGHMEVTASPGDLGWKVVGKFDGDWYEFPDPVGVLTDYEVEAELTTNALTIRSLKGMLGGGPIFATGGVDLSTPGAPLILHLKGSDLLVVADEELARIRVNPDVKITITEGPDVKIEGRIEVPLALYYTEFGPAAPEGGRRRDTASPFGLRFLPAEGGGFHIPGIKDLDAVTLDVEVESTGECRIENSMIGAIVRGKLRLRGPASSPGASGTVEVVKGQVRLTSGLFLRINKAEAFLPDKPGREPYVQFEGSVGRFDREILVTITGPMARPTLRLQSNPPRSQEELLAMLAFGRTPGSLEGSGALGTLTGKMIEIFGDSWPDPEYEEGFFDNWEFEVMTGSSTERPVPPWELPTRGTSRGTMVRTEYLLNEWLSVVAESDREANLSGDMKLRIRFR